VNHRITPRELEDWLKGYKPNSGGEDQVSLRAEVAEAMETLQLDIQLAEKEAPTDAGGYPKSRSLTKLRKQYQQMSAMVDKALGPNWQKSPRFDSAIRDKYAASRPALIRLAAALPKGDASRRAILSQLKS
tara:strand:+ start:119 stop:511 length:393 start_codon:yes stop_codon:yes gene_type:complete